MSLRESLSAYWRDIQAELFLFLDEAIGPSMSMHRQVALVLEMARIEAFVNHWRGLLSSTASSAKAWSQERHKEGDRP